MRLLSKQPVTSYMEALWSSKGWTQVKERPSPGRLPRLTTAELLQRLSSARVKVSILFPGKLPDKEKFKNRPNECQAPGHENRASL